MERRGLKRSGMLHWRQKLIRAKRPALTLSLLCVLSAPIVGCFATTQGTATTGRSEMNRQARCSGWEPLDYSAEGDTPQTVYGIRKHNRTGVNKRCWK